MKAKLLSLVLGSIVGVASSVASAYDIGSMSIDEIEVQAKKEGEMTFSVWYLQDQWRIFVREFEQEYGIKVRIPEGTLEGNMKKIIAEKDRDTGRMDAVAISLDRADMFRRMGMLLDMSVIQDGYRKTTLSGEPRDNKAFAFWGNQIGLAYDPDRVDESTLPQTFEEMSDWINEHPEQFGFNDPNGGGAGQAFIQSAIRNLAPVANYTQDKVDANVTKTWEPVWSWFESTEGKYVLTASNADSLSRLNDGEIAITPAWEDHMDGLQQKGAVAERMKIYIPEFGMGGSGNMVVVPVNAKHKAASVLFVQWLTSKETQSRMNEMFGSAPQHPESDDSKSLISKGQRQNSTDFFSNNYKNASIRAFLEEIIM
ncbi:extracellular solute-binding protein [Endozoicomonas ascidiicola]|uniref:extracellular solute-binding protein n=1 Tax=Endozoicomonas ascidiicola TaxID=1698521 RepID=UPI000831CB5D|nr:extracellular solute-binding protein [Endozoicomonas ascidiicola]